MTVSNVSSTTSPYQANFKQRFQDFKALASALQSGNLSGAQQAFTTFQSDLQQTQQSGQNSQPFDPNSPVGKDFQALQSALQSGDLSSAQQSFATLRQDAAQSRKAAQANASSAQNSQTNPVSQDLQTLQSALKSGDLTGAQKAFATLQQDLQSAQGAHHHHHHHGGAAASSTSSTTTPVSTTTTDTSATTGTLNVQA
jgi:outer membrane protein assembly factor BamD (BamD/ComL family)